MVFPGLRPRLPTRRAGRAGVVTPRARGAPRLIIYVYAYTSLEHASAPWLSRPESALPEAVGLCCVEARCCCPPACSRSTWRSSPRATASVGNGGRAGPEAGEEVSG